MGCNAIIKGKSCCQRHSLESTFYDPKLRLWIFSQSSCVFSSTLSSKRLKRDIIWMFLQLKKTKHLFIKTNMLIYFISVLCEGIPIRTPAWIICLWKSSCEHKLLDWKKAQNYFCSVWPTDLNSGLWIDHSHFVRRKERNYCYFVCARIRFVLNQKTL